MRQRRLRFPLAATEAILLALVVGFSVPPAGAQGPPAQQAPPASRPAGPPRFPIDPRVQLRSYYFADAKKDMPYALFVSSKVQANRKAPLIVMLHGLGVDDTFMLRGKALDLAEQGGYILVGPMGYNIRGWYGVPAVRRANAVPRPPQSAEVRRRFAALGPQPSDPPNMRELSEEDVMNVLALVRKQYNVDPQRIYLMGHSMGGAGTLHIAEKYPRYWAAVAVMAPAAFGMDPESIAAITQVPVLFVHGESDQLVPIAISRSWVAAMKAHHMTYEFDEIPGATHGSVIALGMPKVFEFFGEHAMNRTH